MTQSNESIKDLKLLRQKLKTLNAFLVKAYIQELLKDMHLL